MLRKGLFMVLLCALFSAHAQSPFLKVSLYFENDKYILTETHNTILSSALQDLNDYTIKKIVIRGNTDANADSLYNIQLSDKRAKSVSDYLITQGLNTGLFKVDHYGEDRPLGDNTTEEGRQMNRRVDVIFLYAEKKPSKESEIPVEEIFEKAPDPSTPKCDRDTNIILPSGVFMKMQLCEYLEMEGCLSVETFTTPAAIQEAGLSTYDSSGSPLASGGMFSFTTCDSVCFKKPIVIRTPVPCNVRMNMFVYTMNANGQWASPRSGVKVVSINGQYYYEFEISCINKSLSINLDCKICPSKRKCRYKTLIKAKGGVELKEVMYSTECPLANYYLKISKNGNKAKVLKPAFKAFNADVKITAVHQDTTLVTGFRNIHTLEPLHSSFLFGVSRKYKVAPDSFVKPTIDENIRF